ncbi:MAG: single-stranded DNA-binding protein [Planctomycetia bacterium]|nr:single-stranded DNA-binding protein [Planctomycetia bacterium]
MANLNKVMLIGRLTRDPETRHTQGGQSVTNFGLAVNRSYRKKDSDEKVEETTFIDVEAWGVGGETFARYMKKGRQAYIEGRLKLDSWEKDGQKRTKLSVVMEEFQFLDGGAGGGGGGPGGGPGGGASGGMGGDAPARPARRPASPAPAAPDDNARFDDDIPF